MLNRQIHEEACDWFVRMRDGENDPSVQRALMAWLRKSPEHVGAYLDVAGIWTEMKGVEADSDLGLEQRIAEARADRDVEQLSVPMTTQKPARPRLLAMAASILILVLGAVLVFAWRTHSASDYTAGLGELRSISLPDGSRVELNSQSRIKVRFDRQQRSIELITGQGLFTVAKDASRPFVVSAGKTSVRAVGTVFDVYRRKDDAVITVVEGRVIVQGSNNVDKNVEMNAGKKTVATASSVASPESANIAATTAWTRRQLIFEFAPLGEVAEEFNRYNARRLLVEGDVLKAFKISAIFESTDPASLVRFLHSMPEVRIEQTNDAIVISPAQDSAP